MHADECLMMNVHNEEESKSELIILRFKDVAVLDLVVLLAFDRIQCICK